MIDPKIQKRVLERYAQRRRASEDELSRRTREVQDKIPEIAAIGKELRTTVLQVARAAFESGTDPKPRIDAVKNRHVELIAKRSELLVQNGYPAEYLNLAPSCKKCSDYGYIDSKPCSCFLEECVKEQGKELSSVLDIKGQNFDNFIGQYYSNNPGDGEGGVSPRQNMESFLDFFQDYAWNFGRHSINMLFYGGPGLGKTFMSSCIAKEVALKGFSVTYDTAINIFGNLEKEKFGENYEELQMQIKRYMLSDLLIIDDLGTELTTSFVCSSFYNLLNTRLIERRQMIISTNLSPKEIAARYTPQIASRLSFEFDRFHFFGKDVRQVMKENRRLRY
ncbi:MAG: ATP-binding protein [Clostridiales bacterium]|nr:ATP-binding protein [Clostridiales bacterium]